MPSQQERSLKSNLISFSDFSPGIIQRTGVLGTLQYSPAPLGAASITNTYRCCALPGGGLGPLPKHTGDLLFTDHSTTNLPASTTGYITGFKIAGPMYKKTSSSAPQMAKLSARPFELHIGYEYVSSGTRNHVWRKYPYYSSDASVVINSATATDANTFQVPTPTSFVITRMFPSAPTVAGYTVVVGSWVLAADPPIANTDYAMIYPDPTDGTTVVTDTPYDLTNLFAGLGIGHQNRYVSLFRGESAHGANGGVFLTNEFIKYTLPNTYTQDGSGSSLFGAEHPNGIGAFGSLTASDLLLIKHAGGAFLIQGDLNSPITRHYPSVTPTGGVECYGTDSPFGFCYLVNNDGVYSWGGGDQSINLSTQLEDGFWQVPGLLTYRFGGQLYSWGDGIVVPNNFLFDGKAWWRFEDPSIATYYLYDKDPVNNIIYAAKPSFSDTDHIIAGAFDLTTPATNFSWQSQPINVNDRRRMRVRSCYITAQGSGTVTVTITPTDNTDPNTQPSAFTVSTTGPSRVKMGCNILATELVVRIVSDGGSNPAPIVYQVDLEVEEASNMVVQ